MNKENDTIWYILALIAGVGLGILAFTAFVLASSSTSTTTTATTTILSKFYPLTGYASSNTEVLFYTNTSPVGCISYAVVKNYAYNVTSQKLYLVNETKITSATSVENLYNIVGNSDLADNQQELFMAINGTSNYYVTILQNQTLLCGG